MHNNVKVKKEIYISYKHTAESFFSEHLSFKLRCTIKESYCSHQCEIVNITFYPGTHL